jgi:hypothetical protein
LQIKNLDKKREETLKCAENSHEEQLKIL